MSTLSPAISQTSFGTVQVAFTRDYLYFHNSATGWQGEVVGEAARRVAEAMQAMSPALAQIRFSALGSRFGQDVSERALRAFFPSLHDMSA